MTIRIGCSGLAQPGTGIRVVQNDLYPRLQSDFGAPAYSPERDIGNKPAQKLIGLFKGLCPPLRAYDIFISITPPMPLFIRRPVVAVVLDLRWQRTKGKIGAAYRKWDLRRTVRTSTSIVCISERTKRDLVEMFPEAAPKARVAWLGPGLMAGHGWSDSDSGKLLLIGGAPHKQNERAARLLASARPPWLRGVVGIGVSPEVQRTVDEAFGLGFGSWYRRLTDEEVVQKYQDAQYYMLLGTEEGFGMPFVESLAAGCQVIAVDHELVRELLGDACTYLSEDDALNAKLLQGKPQTPANKRKAELQKFSWQSFYRVFVEEISNAQTTKVR